LLLVAGPALKRFALFHPIKHSLLGTPACFACALPALAPQFTLCFLLQGPR
jgi:hypothetical protein